MITLYNIYTFKKQMRSFARKNLKLRRKLETNKSKIIHKQAVIHKVDVLKIVKIDKYELNYYESNKSCYSSTLKSETSVSGFEFDPSIDIRLGETLKLTTYSGGEKKIVIVYEPAYILQDDGSYYVTNNIDDVHNEISKKESPSLIAYIPIDLAVVTLAILLHLS